MPYRRRYKRKRPYRARRRILRRLKRRKYRRKRIMSSLPPTYIKRVFRWVQKYTFASGVGGVQKFALNCLTNPDRTNAGEHGPEDLALWNHIYQKYTVLGAVVTMTLMNHSTTEHALFCVEHHEDSTGAKYAGSIIEALQAPRGRVKQILLMPQQRVTVRMKYSPMKIWKRDLSGTDFNYADFSGATGPAGDPTNRAILSVFTFNPDATNAIDVESFIKIEWLTKLHDRVDTSAINTDPAPLPEAV